MNNGAYSISLIKQMAECDANYIRLLKLVPWLGGIREHSGISGKVAEFWVADRHSDENRVTVEISVLEAFKYTTTLQIVQKPGVRKWLANPTIQVRVYHDASTAEVVACEQHREFKPKYPQPNPQMHQTDEKLQVNRFLGEWLSHCLEAGRCATVPDSVFSA